MADAFKVLYNGQPGSSAATIYTVPGATKTVIPTNRVKIYNGSGASAQITLYVGGTTDPKRFLDVTMAAGDMIREGGLDLEATQTIAARSIPASAVNVLITGDEIT